MGTTIHQTEFIFLTPLDMDDFPHLSVCCSKLKLHSRCNKFVIIHLYWRIESTSSIHFIGSISRKEAIAEEEDALVLIR